MGASPPELVSREGERAGLLAQESLILKVNELGRWEGRRERVLLPGHCPEGPESEVSPAPKELGSLRSPQHAAHRSPHPAHRWLWGRQHPPPPGSSLQSLPQPPHPCRDFPRTRAPYSLAPILGLLELVPFVLGVLLLQGPDPGDDLLQGLVGLLGVIDDEGQVLLLLWAVIHRSAPTGLCTVGDREEVSARGSTWAPQ